MAGEKPAGALQSRLRRIEAAFRASDASSLRPSFVSSGKVRVDLPEVAELPASYAPGQLQVIFGRLFEASPTREFAFRDEDVTVPSPGTAFARSRWVRRAAPGQADVTETLTFTLREEAGDWRIHEILAAR